MASYSSGYLLESDNIIYYNFFFTSIRLQFKYLGDVFLSVSLCPGLFMSSSLFVVDDLFICIWRAFVSV